MPKPTPHPRPYGPILVGKKGLVTLPLVVREDAGIEEGTRLYLYWWPGESRMLLYIGADPTDEGHSKLT